MYLRDATYEEVRVNLCCFMPNKDEHWQAVIDDNGELLGYLLSDLNDTTLRIHVLEVLCEGCRHGSKIIHWLFNTYNLDVISGYSIAVASHFWSAIGATDLNECPINVGYREDIDEEIEWEGEFVLTRSNFLNYWENRYLF